MKDVNGLLQGERMKNMEKFESLSEVPHFKLALLLADLVGEILEKSGRRGACSHVMRGGHNS